MRSDNLVFSIVEHALGRSIDPIDRELIETAVDLDSICLTVPADLSILRSADFFRENHEYFYMVQLGEFLSFKNLELDKPFVAYTRNPVGGCPLSGKSIHEMLAYKPDSAT